MDDPLLVGGFERLGNLPRDGQGVVEGNRSAGDALRQILTLDQFHHERPDAAVFFEAVDVGDVRVVQRRERLGFAGEPCQPFGVAGEEVGQHFQRNVTIEGRVAGSVYLPHPAFANQRADFVDAEAGAGGEGQCAAAEYTPGFASVAAIFSGSAG